jgi:hypothetical protein
MQMTTEMSLGAAKRIIVDRGLYSPLAASASLSFLRMRLEGNTIQVERRQRRSKPLFRRYRTPDFLHAACNVRNDATDIFSPYSLGTVSRQTSCQGFCSLNLSPKHGHGYKLLYVDIQ